ncbi:MAG: phage portal protein [Oscillospiraceae bacterium]|nr:phage portal protein [Eubacterium sp.]MBR3585862.1 phage portal protein [Oscillospiraceae bacterium]
MSGKRRNNPKLNKRDLSNIEKENKVAAFVLADLFDDCCASGYTRLSDNPEIQTACLRIAELIGSMTIYLMENGPDGDRRILNELSRKIDIEPNRNMTRSHWMTANVMNMLLYGKGNGICVPHTHEGNLESLEPISASRVTFQPVGNSYRDYRVLIDGIPKDPNNLLHFVYNPDPTYLWMGRGVTVTLKDIANNLKQAQKTENAFMSSEYKPNIIVKVDALADEFATPAGRQKLLDSYVKPSTTGEPWLIPAEQFEVQEVRPLTLADLAIKDTVELDKKTVAAVIGVPAFLLGVGTFNREEWNRFIQTKVKAIALNIQQELTRCLIISPKWYIYLNYWSLMDYDLKAVSDILLAGSDRGFVCGDEWRDRMHLPPAGLKEFKILENYIPYDKSGDQEKLK